MQPWAYCVVMTTTSLELGRLTDEELWKIVEGLPSEAPAVASTEEPLYKSITLRHFLAEEKPTMVEDVAQTFTELGLEGWELVSVINTALNSSVITTYYFKRLLEVAPAV